MSQVGGLISFTIGGALLLFEFYSILENANKPWIDTGLFTFFFVLPLGFVAFFLLGLGLFLLVESVRSQNVPPPSRKH